MRSQLASRPPRRFATHLLRVVLAVALPFILLAGGLVTWTALGRRADDLRRLGEVTRALQLDVDRQLGMTLAALEALATSPAIDQALATGIGGQGAAAFHAQATALIARRPAAMSIVWLQPADAPRPIVNTRTPPGTPPAPLADWHFPRRPLGEPPKPGIAFAEAVATRRPYISDLVRSPVAGWTVVVALPVLRGDRVVAVLAAGLQPANLAEVLKEQLATDQDGLAVLVDRGGVVVARTAGEEGYVGMAAGADALAFQRDPTAAAAGRSAVTLDGTSIYAAYRRLSLVPFAIGYGAPRAVVNAPLLQALVLSGAGGMLTLALASGAALWLGRRLGGEVAALGADALLIADGRKPPPRVPSRVLELVAAQEALLGSTAALRESERRLRLAQEAAGIGVWERDLVTGVGSWSVEEYHLHGLDPAQPVPDLAAQLAMILPQDRDQALRFAQRDEAAAPVPGGDGAPLQTEYRIRRADNGAVRWLQLFGRVLHDAGGVPVRMLGVTLDVTERRQAEERQMLLMREVDHRAKNALAVAVSIAHLTPRNLPPAEFAAAITGRITAMAKVHSLLAAERWAGVDLRTMVTEEVAVYAGRVRVAGPSIQLAAGAAQPLAMIFHELATNAAKHGALSRPDGGVEITWQLASTEDEAGLHLTWREWGGPPLNGLPARRGFGSKLLSSLPQHQLGGSLIFDWSDLAGLTVTLDIPARHLVASASAGSEGDTSSMGAAALAPALGKARELPPGVRPRVLLVEDEPLLAMQATAWLQALGCEVIGPAHDLATALRLALAEPNLAVALLDVNLGSGDRVFPVVDVLRTRGVPFLITTGYASAEVLTERAEDAVAILRKPFDREALAEALGRALSRREL